MARKLKTEAEKAHLEIVGIYGPVYLRLKDWCKKHDRKYIAIVSRAVLEYLDKHEKEAE